jgi:hypothetical protein
MDQDGEEGTGSINTSTTDLQSKNKENWQKVQFKTRTNQDEHRSTTVKSGRGNMSHRSYRYRQKQVSQSQFTTKPTPFLHDGIQQLQQSQSKATTNNTKQKTRPTEFSALIDNEGGYYDALLATEEDEVTTDSVAEAIAAANEYENAAIADYEADMDACLNAPIPSVVLTPTRQLNPGIQQAIVRHNPYASEGFRNRQSQSQTGPTGPSPGA